MYQMVYQVELVVEASPGLGDGCGVGQHADGSGDLGGITSGHDSWWLKVKNYFVNNFQLTYANMLI
jgi:hypothetical protein